MPDEQKSNKLRPLTLKQKRFVEHYLKSGNGTEAAKLAGYKDSDGRVTLATQAYQNLRNPQIQKAIEQALVITEVTPEWIVNEFKKIATSEQTRTSDRLRSFENLAKIIELTGFKQNSQPQTQINGDITISFGSTKPKDYIDATVVTD